MTLSDFHIKKLAPKKARFELSDGKGLSLRVMPTGKKTWVYRYMIDGKARRMTLGTYPGFITCQEHEKNTLLPCRMWRAALIPAYKQKEAKAASKSSS